MPMPDIFQNDLFSTNSLTAAINRAEFVPNRLGALGLFEAQGITTTHVTIEESNGELALVEAKPRGGDASPVSADKRRGIPFEAIHLPERSTLMADEIQNVREFGTEDQTRAVETVVNRRLEKMRRNIEATHEWQRVGAMRGQILDADGSTVLVDVFDRFNLTQQSVNMNFGSSDVQTKTLDVQEAIEDELGSLPFSTVRVFCGSSFWRNLLNDSSVQEAYNNHAAAVRLREDPRESFEFGGVIWERYRGKVGGNPYVPDAEAYAVPEGVPELMISRFAPADFTEAVNSIGLPVYAKSEPMRFDKGVELEVQSNPIHLPTRPRAIIKLTEA